MVKCSPLDSRPGTGGGGVGRQRRERNFRPLPQPMEGSNTAIGQTVQSCNGFDREQTQCLFTEKIPGVFDSARDSVPVAHDDSTTLLGICTHEAGRCLKVFKRTRPLPPPSPLRTPPNRHLLPSNPLRAPLGQVLPLRNQTLVNRTGEQGDAVPSHLVAEVLTGHTNA